MFLVVCPHEDDLPLLFLPFFSFVVCLYTVFSHALHQVRLRSPVVRGARSSQLHRTRFRDHRFLQTIRKYESVGRTRHVVCLHYCHSCMSLPPTVGARLPVCETSVDVLQIVICLPWYNSSCQFIVNRGFFCIPFIVVSRCRARK